MIYRTPQIMRLSIDPHEDFVNVQTPVRIRSSLNAMFSDLVGEHRTEATPPESYRLVADVDVPLEQNILDLSQRQWIADVHHHREANHLRRAVEITEGIAHRRRLGMSPARLKPICSDKTGRTNLLPFLPPEKTRMTGSPGSFFVPAALFKSRG